MNFLPMFRRKRRYRKKSSLKLKSESLRSILAISFFLGAVFSLLALFGQAAGIGITLDKYLSYLFGWGAFIFPFLLADLAYIFFDYRRNRFASPLFLIGLIIFFLSLLSLLHFFIREETAQTEALLGQGGGVLGFYLQFVLKQYLSSFFTFLLLLASLTISFLIILNTSLDVFVNKVSSLVMIFWHGLNNTLLAKVKAWLDKKRSTEVDEEAYATDEPSFKVLSSETSPEQDDEVVPSTEDFAFEKMTPALEPIYAEGTPKRITSRVETVTNPPFPEKVWESPPLSLLIDSTAVKPDQTRLNAHAKIIESTLESFGVQAKVVEVNLGPAFTQYALELTHGTKISKVTNLQHDLALSLATPTGTVRIEAPIPGKSLVGIEVPNSGLKVVNLKNVLVSKVMQETKSVLAVALGEDVSGRAVVADITRMPHVLIAGSTGSGKSVLINAMIATFLFRCSPSEVRLILIDPKRVELSQFKGIPHLLTDVITDPTKVINSLSWAIDEMQRRYSLFEKAGVRNILGYNEASGFQALPYIVIIIDELAEVIMTAPREVEAAICRLAQLARATGIHLIIATQRPSVDILTGLIKANIPCRIAFNVSSMIDSRVIIDQPGAEKLLGKGDMLFIPPESSKPLRIQGVFVSDQEINALIDFLQETGFEPNYIDEIIEYKSETVAGGGFSEKGLFKDALEVVLTGGSASTSYLQRKLKIGYNKAADLMEELEKRNVISPPDGSKKRHVLISDPSQVLGLNNKDNDESWGNTQEETYGETP